MALAFVAEAVNDEPTNGTAKSITVSVPSHSTGDFLVTSLVHSDDNPTTTLTPASGWTEWRGKTQLGAIAASPPVLYVYYRVASSEPANYTWTWDKGGGLMASCRSYSGQHASSPLGQNSFNAQTSTGSTAICPDITTANDGEMALFIGVCDGPNGQNPPTGVPSGVSNASNTENSFGGDGASLLVADELRATAGATGTRTWTLAFSNERSGASLSIIAAVVGGRPPLSRLPRQAPFRSSLY